MQPMPSRAGVQAEQLKPGDRVWNSVARVEGMVLPHPLNQAAPYICGQHVWVLRRSVAHPGMVRVRWSLSRICRQPV